MVLCKQRIVFLKFIPSEPRAEVYCFRLNFNKSKLVYSGVISKNFEQCQEHMPVLRTRSKKSIKLRDILVQLRRGTTVCFQFQAFAVLLDQTQIILSSYGVFIMQLSTFYTVWFAKFTDFDPFQFKTSWQGLPKAGLLSILYLLFVHLQRIPDYNIPGWHFTHRRHIYS